MVIQHISYKRPVQVVRKSFPRILGTVSLYSIGYGDVGSSIYYALGVTAFYALGATPLVLAIAGVFFVFTALTYAEGSAMIPEAGGSSSFARRGFNELVSFISGWGLMLNYVVTIAISAITVPFYLSHFWPVLKTNPLLSTLVGIGIIAGLALLNIIGVRETSRLNILFALLDLFTQALLILVGIVFLFNIQKLLGNHPSYGGVVGLTWPTLHTLVYGVSIAMVAYIGLESVSQMAEESRDPQRTIPRSLMLSVFTVLLMYAGISTIALSAMPLSELTTVWHEDPIAGIAHHLPTLTIGKFAFSLSTWFGPWIAILAATILIIASNAGIMGASRLAFSMGAHKQLPPQLVRIHRVFKTPFVSILFFGGASILLLSPGFFSKGILLKLADLYGFGAMLAFSTAHASIIALRIREPNTPRPFKMGLNFSVVWKKAKIELPIPAVIGFLCSVAVWIVIVVTHPWGRNVGLLWLLIGIILYALYRKSAALPLAKTSVTDKVIEASLAPTEIRFSRILIPLWGTSSSEEMVKAACKIAKLDGSRLHALYVIEVPQSLPLDVHISEEVERAEAALDRAELIASEYGVKLETKLVQSRFAGRTIVEESETNKSDLILFGGAERSRIGDLLHGKTMNYVLTHASCRVWTSLASGKT